MFRMYSVCEKRCLVSEFSKEDEIRPSFSFWSPWIGENTRKDDFVFNTEYKKCPASNTSTSTSDETVDDAVPEETLFHLLLHEKVLSFFEGGWHKIYMYCILC